MWSPTTSGGLHVAHFDTNIGELFLGCTELITHLNGTIILIVLVSHFDDLNIEGQHRTG